MVLLCYKIPLRLYRRGSYWLMAGSIILLAIPVITHQLRTITIAGISIQPSEIAKITIVLYLARVIEVSKFDTFKDYALKILLPLGIACLLCLMGSVSATLIICFVSFIILICSKIPKKFVLWTVPIVIGAVTQEVRTLDRSHRDRSRKPGICNPHIHRRVLPNRHVHGQSGETLQRR